ncbi:MAG TPA: hypothetical protein VIN67_06905, partial [Desulfobaccales bacterium]
TILLVVLAAACTSQPAKTLADTPENRTAEAKRYLEAMPPKEMLHDVAERVGPRFPEKERPLFLQVMASPAMEKAAYRIILNALVKNFTVGELKAMVDYYGSPEGHSAYKKSVPFMSETIPQIQQEVKNSMAALPKEPTPPPQPAPAPKGPQKPQAGK